MPLTPKAFLVIVVTVWVVGVGLALQHNANKRLQERKAQEVALRAKIVPFEQDTALDFRDDSPYFKIKIEASETFEFIQEDIDRFYIYDRSRRINLRIGLHTVGSRGGHLESRNIIETKKVGKREIVIGRQRSRFFVNSSEILELGMPIVVECYGSVDNREQVLEIERACASVSVTRR
ncbi:hypothetical protein [Deinococcus multiflagellatus]|uniref:Uncharacterized protein n=1 Tax=Deinococcus multiflagellatus TaxID=1656887 RepID=A0ABW1ZG57_9DEIO|nr:hypothetical protein [Deinococcus multiflagellatus]MBZ9712103.1 hypothetical protein [Deinococcus multiflagellatus]